MNRTRNALAAALVATGLALAACGGPGTPTAAPATTTDTPPPTTTDAPPTTTTDAPSAANVPTPAPRPPAPAPPGPPTTDTPAPAPALAPVPMPPVVHLPAPAPAIEPAPPVIHPPAQPAPVAPVAPAPAPAPVVSVNHPPAPAPAPSSPRPVAPPVVQAPPPAPAPTAPPVSSWQGIYDAFVASHPGPTYRVFDTGNYGNTTTNGAGTVVMVSIAPKTPADILYSVMLHEYGHYRQNLAYGPGLGYAVRAVGSPNLDHAADCWAQEHGATWLNYGCTDNPAVRGILARMGG